MVVTWWIVAFVPSVSACDLFVYASAYTKLGKLTSVQTSSAAKHLALRIMW